MPSAMARRWLARPLSWRAANAAQDDVVQLQKRIAHRERLDFEYVETGAGQSALAQGVTKAD